MSQANLFEWSRKFNRPFILDGAMGSIIQNQYPSLFHFGIWMNKAIFQHPDFIQNLHYEYIKAGADIITSFTFRTNPYALRLADEEKHCSEDLVRLAVNLCLEAKKLATKPILIAGSNATMVQCYTGNLKDITEEEIYENHEPHIKSLMKAGADFIMNETFGHLKEIKIVCEICKNNNIPFVISLYCDEKLELFSGESLQEGIEIIKKYSPMAIGFNCVKYSTMKKIVNEINLKELVWGFYMNCGDEKMQEIYKQKDGKVDFNLLDVKVTAEELKEFSEDIIKKKKLRPAFIGSCCCSNSEHTRKLVEIFEESKK